MPCVCVCVCARVCACVSACDLLSLPLRGWIVPRFLLLTPQWLRPTGRRTDSRNTCHIKASTCAHTDTHPPFLPPSTANDQRVTLSSENDMCDYICASFLDVSPHHPHTLLRNSSSPPSLPLLLYTSPSFPSVTGLPSAQHLHNHSRSTGEYSG